MFVRELAEQCGWRLLAGSEGTEAVAKGCYVGDLLSWVMARARSGDVYVTVMGNVNAVAVAVLTDAAAIVLTEDAPFDDDAALRAEQQGIAVYTCSENSYETAVRISRCLQE